MLICATNCVEGIPVTKSDREIMEILEAFELTRCAHSAAQLAGVDEKTVARCVTIRDQGRDPLVKRPRPRSIDTFVDKIEEWVDKSQGKVRADGASAAAGGGIHRHRPVDAARGRRREDSVESWPPPRISSVAARAWHVAAVRLGRRPEGRRAADAAVLRMAVVVAVSAGDPVVGPDPGVAGAGRGCDVAPDRWRANVFADRQPENGDGGSGRRVAGAASTESSRRDAITAARWKRVSRSTRNPRAARSTR